MNEEPKSIWKKSWSGRYGLRAWLLVAGATFLIILTISFFLPGGPRTLSDWIVALLMFLAGSLIIAGLFLGLWGFIRWLCCWRNLKRFIFALACLVTLIALFYAEEDWRGWHDWNQFKHQWEAKGEKFDWQSVVPPPVPDDQNFAFSPVWIAEERYLFQNEPKRAEAWYGNRIYSEEVSKLLPMLPVSESGLVGTNWYPQSHLPNMPEWSGGWAVAHASDLRPWQAYYRGLEETNPAAEIPIAPRPQSPAQDVLLALSKFDPVIEQLRQDGARPDSRFPIGYDDENKAMILLPHLAAVKRYSLVLRLRAIAELQAGQTDKALADVKLSLRLVDAIRTEPILISHLVRIAMLQITLQPVYEGLANHRWSDAQLAELNAELAKLDFLAGYKLAMRGEMNFCQLGTLDYFRRHPERLADLEQTYPSGPGEGDNILPPGLEKILYRLIPSGVFYQNQLLCARTMVEFCLPAANLKERTVSPEMARRASAAEEAEIRHRTPDNFFARLFLPSMSGAVERFAYAQASVDLARTAIALERYRLAHGEFPESLDALAPQFIAQVPHDVIGGQPLHYRRTSDGQFVLYSVGWNETDDGGVVVYRKGSTSTVDINQGDWVWKYPKDE